MGAFIDLSGKRFGRLIVVERAEDYISPKGARQTQWLCECDCGNKKVMKSASLKSGNPESKSCGCLKEELRDKRIAENVKNSVNLSGEKSDYKKEKNALCDYVQYNVMGYDKAQRISKSMVARLLGLRHGRYMDNNKIEKTADYPIEVILNTFKICNPQIQNAFRTKSFADETHKLNYAIKIVENNLNSVYVRMQKAKWAKEEAENYDHSKSSNYVNRYKVREDYDDNDGKFDDLW